MYSAAIGYKFAPLLLINCWEMRLTTLASGCTERNCTILHTGWPIWSRTSVCWHQFQSSIPGKASYNKTQLQIWTPQKLVRDQMGHPVLWNEDVPYNPHWGNSRSIARFWGASSPWLKALPTIKASPVPTGSTLCQTASHYACHWHEWWIPILSTTCATSVFIHWWQAPNIEENVGSIANLLEV